MSKDRTRQRGKREQELAAKKKRYRELKRQIQNPEETEHSSRYDVINETGEILITFPRINSTSEKEFAITIKQQKQPDEERIIDLIPLKHTHGIYFIKTAKRTKKDERIKLRIAILDIKNNVHFSNRNGLEEFCGVPMFGTSKDTIILASGAEVTYDRLEKYLPEETLNEIFSSVTSYSNVLVSEFDKHVPRRDIQGLIEFLTNIKSKVCGLSTLTYYDRVINKNKIVKIDAIPSEFFYDFLRSRLDDPKISFEGYMSALREQRNNVKERGL